MKWKKHKPPARGDRRHKTEFAWQPVECHDDYVRWLTRVDVHEEFQMDVAGNMKWVVFAITEKGCAPPRWDDGL